MKKHKQFMPLVGSLILAITLIVGMFYWLSPKQTVQAISKEEAQATIEQLYNGKVTKIKETTNNYVLTVEMDNGIYEVKVNSTDGKVHSLKLLSQTESEAKQKLLSKEEVETIIKKNDVGTIESIVLQENETNPTYQVTVNHPDEKVIYFVSAFNGEVSKKRIEQQQKKITISEHEAKQIAKNYLNGTIEKVKLQTNGESSHYLVWIDTDDDDVIIQIHAISGKILSVSSDDNDDDEDDDDDDDDDED